MKIYITGLRSGYEVEHLVRLFFPLAPLTLTEPLPEEDAVLASAGEDGVLRAVLRQNGEEKQLTEPVDPAQPRIDRQLANLVYTLLRRETGIRPPWGRLTGVRPVRLIHDARARGESEQQIEELFLQKADCTPQKFALAKSIADLQAPILRAGSGPLDYSLYIGIPFCPSRCSYCSFVSCNLERDRALVSAYVDDLCRELQAIRQEADLAHLHLCSIYIGGGTPTSLNAAQLRQLLTTVKEQFGPFAPDMEYTIEAGRPDCTDREKLDIIKEFGATRISINPQTFSDDVLVNIGRRHTAADIERCFADARAAGHTDINMDLIAGLPGDTVEGFEASLRRAIALDPENITVHTLTLKRASNLMISGEQDGSADVAAMLEKCSLLTQAGYVPYYLYRQKNTLQNLENVGWCKPGHEGYYNIYIMEECQSILSAGSGGSTKLVDKAGNRVERTFNFKYPAEYTSRFDEVLARKKGVHAFYGNSNEETPAGEEPV